MHDVSWHSIFLGVDQIVSSLKSSHLVPPPPLFVVVCFSYTPPPYERSLRTLMIQNIVTKQNQMLFWVSYPSPRKYFSFLAVSLPPRHPLWANQLFE